MASLAAEAIPDRGGDSQLSQASGDCTLRFRGPYELVQNFVDRANAMLDFAGELGLIDPGEDQAIRRSVTPELWQWLEDEDKRLSAET